MTSTLAAVTADFESFYLVEFPKVYRACLAFTRSQEEAWDATQEAFARGLARWKRLAREPWAGGWVMTTAINVCKKKTKAGKSTVAGPTEPGADRVDLVAALRTLPEKQRLAAVLYYVGDRSISEVADAMGISGGAVKSHLSRAREALREKLGGRDGLR